VSLSPASQRVLDVCVVVVPRSVIPLPEAPAASTVISRRQRKKKEAAAAASSDGMSSVVYVGHIPHGFYEEQMRGFFSQFGDVRRQRRVHDFYTICSAMYWFTSSCSSGGARAPVAIEEDGRLQGVRLRRVQRCRRHQDRRRGHGTEELGRVINTLDLADLSLPGEMRGCFAVPIWTTHDGAVLALPPPPPL